MDDGFIVVDKPPNMLSHEVSSYIKKILGIKRAGHAGTLDPHVSGVLVVGLNRSTKLLRFLTMQNKTYVGVVEFKTEMKREEVEKLFKRFTGRISQIPPEKSAVAKKRRFRKVYSLEIIEINGKRVLFKAEVEAGTYIRTLCKDMGGKMLDLRRVKSGSFHEREAYTMDEIYRAKIMYDEGYEFALNRVILSVEEVFERLPYPKINVSKHTVKNLVSGAPVYENGVIEYESFKKNELVSVFWDNRFVGIGISLVDSKDFYGKVLKMKRVHIKI